MRRPLPISVAIPTYRREAVLIDTLRYLLSLPDVAMEILVLDQTETHEFTTSIELENMEKSGQIRWIKLVEPSIPKAMNQALIHANCDIVLFVDDDVRPESDLLVAHLHAHSLYAEALIAGRVIQPWQEGQDFSRDSEFHFASTKSREVDEFIGCNFSVHRRFSLAIGGFDENFVKVAYRFEAEFAHRFRAARHPIWFESSACLHHLKSEVGGTRTFGDFLRTLRPDHSVGAYYFGLRTANGLARFRTFLTRPVSSVMTRHHLRKPWWIPLTLVGEIRAMLWAFVLFLRGPRLLTNSRLQSKNE